MAKPSKAILDSNHKQVKKLKMVWKRNVKRRVTGSRMVAGQKQEWCWECNKVCLRWNCGGREMKCRKQKGSQKSGLRVQGVTRGRKCCRREVEWQEHVGSEAEWREQK